MLFKNVTILDENLEIVKDCCVQTKADRISYIGREVPADEKGRVIDGSGRLLMPGFFNAHGHNPMSILRGYGENMSLQDWLFTRIFPFEDHLDSNAVYWGTMLSMAESLKYGIVSTSDMYYFCNDMVKAVADSGCKANICRSISNTDGIPPEKHVPLAESKALYTEFHNSFDGRIKIDLSIHSEYTADAPTTRALAEFGRELDTVAHVHISETRQEHEDCIQRHGKTPAAFFADLGFFDMPAIAAHCIYSTDEDLEIFREKGVTVATCPVSNMKLASGICDIGRILAKGVRVAIGTDSAASNNNLDFLGEIKTMATGAKAVAADPTVVTPAEAIKAATLNGALAQKRNDSGCIREGNKADLILLDISGPNMHPCFNMLNNLVYSAASGDIKMTMVDGKVLYENGEYTTIDIEKTIAETEKAVDGILGRL